MSCTAEYNFCVVAGDSLNFRIRYKAAGEYVDIEGYTVRMQLRVRATDELPVIETVGIVNDKDLGEFKFSLTPEETTTLVKLPKTKARYIYDVEVIDTSGVIETLLSGSIEVNIGVTR